MNGLAFDFRFALRSLWKRPAFSLLAALVLALGMGTATTMFSLVDALLLRPLAVESPERLVRFYTSSTAGLRFFTLSFPDYRDIAALEEVFTGVAADEPLALAMRQEGRVRRLYAYMVTENYFELLGLRPTVGRFFDGSDGPRVAVVGNRLWRADFAGDRQVVGEQLTLNGEPFTIIGVAPEAFSGTHRGLRPELWVPMGAQELLSMATRRERRGARGYFAIGRLREGVTFEDARARVDLLAEHLQSTYPESNRGVTFNVLCEAQGRVHPLARDYVVGVSGAAAFVVVMLLLLACTNVAGLLIARGAGRRRELGVRAAIGSGPYRIVRQLLVESLLLALVAGAFGLAMTWSITAFVSAIELPTERPIALELGVDHRVVLFSLAALVLTTLAAGLVPALRASRPNLMDVMRDAGSTSSQSQWRLRRVLVSGQVALSVLLLLTAGLFLESLTNAGDTEIGFEPDGLAMASVDSSLHRYDRPRAGRFFGELTDRLSRHPAIESVALASSIPLSLNIVRAAVSPEGSDDTRGDTRLSVDLSFVDEHYFGTIGIPVLEGRGFEAGDGGGPRVAVVNEMLARTFWPSGHAAGKRLYVGDDAPYEIVGVVRSGKYLSLGEEPKPFLYFPRSPSESFATTVVVKPRSHVSSLVALRTLTEEILELDAGLAIYEAKTMEEHLRLSLLPARASATVAGFFGAAAIALVAVGLYGLLAQGVAERTREIGIRRALGARSPDVVGLFLRQGIGIVWTGLAFGLPAAPRQAASARASCTGWRRRIRERGA